MSRKMLYNPFIVGHPLCFDVNDKYSADGYATADGDWLYRLVLDMYEIAKNADTRETREAICDSAERFIRTCYCGPRVVDVLMCDQLDWLLRMGSTRAARTWRKEHPLAYKKFLKDTNTKEL